MFYAPRAGAARRTGRADAWPFWAVWRSSEFGELGSLWLSTDDRQSSHIKTVYNICIAAIPHRRTSAAGLTARTSAWKWPGRHTAQSLLVSRLYPLDLKPPVFQSFPTAWCRKCRCDSLFASLWDCTDAIERQRTLVHSHEDQRTTVRGNTVFFYKNVFGICASQIWGGNLKTRNVYNIFSRTDIQENTTLIESLKFPGSALRWCVGTLMGHNVLSSPHGKNGAAQLQKVGICLSLFLRRRQYLVHVRLTDRMIRGFKHVKLAKLVMPEQWFLFSRNTARWPRKLFTFFI